MKIKNLTLALLFIVGLCACTQTQTKTPINSTLKFAKGFNIEERDSFALLTIFNPWVDGETMQTAYLVPRSNPLPTSIPDGAIVVRTPIERIAITSCTHIEPLNLLGRINTVAAVCSPEIIYNAEICDKVNSKIANLGDPFNINIERLSVTHPDIIMLTGYNGFETTYQLVGQAGVPIIFNNEWTESDVLARAEWLKLFGALYELTDSADSIFNSIVEQYTQASSLAQSVEHHPKVMTGSNFKGTWYMPDGKGYMAQLFADAGADYYYKNGESSESLPLNFETVLANFADAEVWLNAPEKTIDALIAMDERHALFAPVKTGRIYAFLARTTPSGANDFWESGVYNPHLVLKDLIFALHPNLLPDYSPTYILKLE